MLEDTKNALISKKNARIYKDCTYRSLQRTNSVERAKLSKFQQSTLASNGFQNIGWDHIIKLHEELIKINLAQNTTLEDLFLNADRIANKYQSAEEISEFNQKMSESAARISDLIDSQFPPEDKVEFIDFGTKTTSNAQNKGRKGLKKYRTTTY
jgi:hypothetical protein